MRSLFQAFLGRSQRSVLCRSSCLPHLQLVAHTGPALLRNEQPLLSASSQRTARLPTSFVVDSTAGFLRIRSTDTRNAPSSRSSDTARAHHIAASSIRTKRAQSLSAGRQHFWSAAALRQHQAAQR
eukprot:2571672-Rhodomonas_salina.1